MEFIEQISKRITYLCRESGISIDELSNLSRIPKNKLEDILQLKNEDPSVVILNRICKAFGIKLKDFFGTPEFEYESK